MHQKFITAGGQSFVIAFRNTKMKGENNSTPREGRKKGNAHNGFLYINQTGFCCCGTFFIHGTKKIILRCVSRATKRLNCSEEAGRFLHTLTNG